MKLLSVSVILLGTSIAVSAAQPAVPEIDSSTAVAAIALVSGGLLVLRGRRTK
jgi:hypothetical protein